jgi:DDE_Tnp_1-associated
LEAILTITILTTICGAQNWVEIAHWGQAEAAWLEEFLALTQGIPSHDTFGRVFAVLDPESLQQTFVAWINALADLSQDIVALDGKTIRRSLDRANGKGPIHVVNAWASANELVLAQSKLSGAVVTIDAMGCQVEIARQIQAQGADYVLSLQENQPSLYRDCADLFTWLRGAHPLDQPLACGHAEQVDGGHGQIESGSAQHLIRVPAQGSCRDPGHQIFEVRVESSLDDRGAPAPAVPHDANPSRSALRS